jgi:hypothetical protein
MNACDSEEELPNVFGKFSLNSSTSESFPALQIKHHENNSKRDARLEKEPFETLNEGARNAAFHSATNHTLPDIPIPGSCTQLHPSIRG